MLDTIWNEIRKHTAVIFPILALVWAAFIVLTTFFDKPLYTYFSGSFVRFVLFWFLGVFLVLSFDSYRIKSSKIALISFMLASIIVAIYAFVEQLKYPHIDMFNLVFACSSGAILGTLAGTWGRFIFETYT
ncbi:MAG: hypothetical protein Q4E22_04170, partial [Coriobacteriia bacterium]|nr:hypothetical protein [Coriobacteriia bacterium]